MRYSEALLNPEFAAMVAERRVIREAILELQSERDEISARIDANYLSADKISDRMDDWLDSH